MASGAPFQVLRRGAAGALALGAAAVLYRYSQMPPGPSWTLEFLLLGSAILIQRPQLWNQILARGIWWSHLILGVLLSNVEHQHPLSDLGASLALTAGGALLFAGRIGLDEPKAPGRFLPSAFGGRLMVLLVMAIADALLFLLIGTASFESRKNWEWSLPFLGCGLLLVAAIIGLSRLRVWGLLASIAADLAIAAMALFSGSLRETPLVCAIYLGSAGIRLVLAAPIVIALRTGAPESLPRVSRRGYILSMILVVSLIAAAVAGYVMSPSVT